MVSDFHHSNPNSRRIMTLTGKAKDEYERHLATWGPHCGTSLRTYRGHLDVLLKTVREEDQILLGQAMDAFQRVLVEITGRYLSEFSSYEEAVDQIIDTFRKVHPVDIPPDEDIEGVAI